MKYGPIFRPTKGTLSHLGDGFDLRAQLLFDPMEGESIVVSDQVDRNTEVTKPENEYI
jgi:hypothetical protein